MATKVKPKFTVVTEKIEGKALTDDVVMYHKRQVCKECDTELNYPFKEKSRGQGIIIVNKNFKIKVKEGAQGKRKIVTKEDPDKERKGADNDLKYLKGIYERYDIDHTNFTYMNQVKEGSNGEEKDMVTLIDEFSDKIKQECPVIFVSIATHGGRDGNLEEAPAKLDPTDTTQVEKLVDVFSNNLNLLAIPKVFIIQACRGKSKEESYKDTDDIKEEPVVQFATKHSNFLMIYSTSEGYSSFRSEEQGAWLLETLHRCVTMEKYKNLHFVEIVTVCTFWVINSYRKSPKDSEDASNRSEEDTGKELARATETPTYHSTLMKFLRFPDKKN